MKGTKCPYCESTIPMFHVFFKGKKLSKEQVDRNRKFRSPGYKLSCLQCEREFEVRSPRVLLLFLFCSFFLGPFIFDVLTHSFLPIDGWLKTWFLRPLFSLVLFLLVLTLFRKRLLTTWPIRGESE